MVSCFSKFTKKSKWLALTAAVVVCQQGQADSSSSDPATMPMFKQGEILEKDKYPPAYNAPAAIHVYDGWDWYVTGSYIYWHAAQDGMELAQSQMVGRNSVGTTTLLSNQKTKTLTQEFEYSSGFKIGLGINLGSDDWTSFVEYTRLHQSTHTSKNAPSNPQQLEAVWSTSWFTEENLPANHVNSKWKLHLNLLDWVASRPFYQGLHLTLSPYGGLRGSWINQKLNLAGDVSSTVQSTFGLRPVENPVRSRNRSNQWGVGPTGGVKAHWLLGCGFRVEGDMGASLLYTRFTKVKHFEDTFSATRTLTYVKSKYKHVNTVRAMTEGEIGLGWGMYFGHHQGYHFDLQATYDFNYMWSQNMMRGLLDFSTAGTGASVGDLYLHGLTVSGRFDF